jgi:hypothetical protein
MMDDGVSCPPRYFGSQAVRESIAGHVGSVSKTSQEVLELRRQFTGLAAAYDDDTGSDSGSDAAKESLEEGRVHRGEQGALAMLSPVHPKMQDALGEKKTLRSFFSVRAAYWPGRLSRPYASRISACLSLRKARGACSCQSRGLRREAGKPRPSRFGERAWWTHWPRRRWWT